MSQELVASVYAAFAKGDVPGVLGMFAPDIVWNEAENFIYADGNPYVGPTAILEGVFLRLATEWDGFTVNPEELIVSGDTVVALGRYQATSKATGLTINPQFVHVWRCADGKITRFQQYTDTAQVRDAYVQAKASAV